MLDENELDSTCGISDEELTERFKAAIRIDNEIKKLKVGQLLDMTQRRKWPF